MVLRELDRDTLVRVSGRGGLRSADARGSFEWSAPEAGHRPRARASSDGFRRSALGEDHFLDAGCAYVNRPDIEQRFARPLDGDHVCTVIGFAPDVFFDRVAGADQRQGWRLATRSQLDLHHRPLVTACRRGIDALEAAERLHSLLDLLPLDGGEPIGSPRPSRASTEVAHRQLVAVTGEALAAGYLRSGLDELARVIGLLAAPPEPRLSPRDRSLGEQGIVDADRSHGATSFDATDRAAPRAGRRS